MEVKQSVESGEEKTNVETAIVPFVSSKLKFADTCKKSERAVIVGARRYVLTQGKWNGEEFSEKFGTALFDGAIVLSHYLKDHCEELMREVRGNVVELGCGIGLVSIVASTLLSHEKATVVATDADPKLLELVERNAKKKFEHTRVGTIENKGFEVGFNMPQGWRERGFDHWIRNRCVSVR